MRRGFLLLLIFIGFVLCMQAQNPLPVPDLLDIKFSSDAGKSKVEDVSDSRFPVKYGEIIPAVIYDKNIKQYVSHFPQNTSSRSYYRIDYMDRPDFKSKITESFTIEVYIKAENNKEMCAVGSMHYGGFGIKQTENGSTQLLIGKSGSGYNQIGSKNIYGNIKSDYTHIVYTYDGTNLKSYYNGVNTDNLYNVDKIRLSSTPSYQWIAIGGDVNGSSEMERRFIGEIAMVKMYSEILSSEQVQNLYEQIEKRKSLHNMDRLNIALTKSLRNYSNQTQAYPYLQEGWQLMNSLNTTEQDVENFLVKLNNDLGLAVPQVSKYPRVAVMSDIHVGSANDWKVKISRAVDILKKQEDELDAIFVVGDVSNNGRTDQLKNAVDLYAPISSTIPVYFMMGNHDWWEGGNRESFRSIIGQRTNQFIEIKGYPFIAVSIDGGEGSGQKYIYQSTSKNFLRSALEKASRDYPDKPVFVYMHVPLINTVYGSYPIAPGKVNRAENTEEMKKICEPYPQVIVFSGHSHYPLIDERCIYQESFTSIHDGGMSYSSIEDGLIEGNERNFPGTKNVVEGCIVSVDGNNDVSVKRVDFMRDEEIRKPWLIKAPHDGSMFTYTKERKGGEVPYFAADNKMVISDIKSNSFKVTFPQAKDDEGVHHYLVEVIDKNGRVERKVNLFSGFFLGSDMPDSLSYTVTGLKGIYSDYQIRVTAIDSFYPNNVEHDTNKSEPLTSSVKDQQYEVLYLTGSAVPCGWTNTNPEVMKKQGENGELVWTGLLKKGEFKFLLNKNSWDASINPISTIIIKPEEVYDVNITNGFTGDYKFNVSRDMYCSVIIDTKTWTVKVQENKDNLPLYLVGDATPTGWSNTKATPMIKESNGVYTWSGEMKSGHFKFITQLGTWNSIVPTGKAHETIMSGRVHNISDNYQGDYRFVLGTGGYCTIRVDLNNYTMVLTKKPAQNLYLVGDATPNGWSNTQATPMIRESEGIFSWRGYLKAGHLKFITHLGTWNSIVPTIKAHEDVIPEFRHYVSDNYQGDYRFNLLDAGYYNIYVNLNESTMYIDNLDSNASVYIIGDATPTGWHNNNAMPLDKVGERIYQWKGKLKAGHFKFITRLGTWNSLVPVPTKNETISIGGIHAITNEYRGDYRFIISREDEYTVTLDLDNRTLSVDYAAFGLRDSSMENDKAQITIVTENNSITIYTSVKLDSVRLLDISSRSIDVQKNKSGTFSIGSNLTEGVYLIELVYKGEREVRKILVN